MVGRGVLDAPTRDCGGLGGGSGSPALPGERGEPSVGRGVLDAPPKGRDVPSCGGSGSPALPHDCGVMPCGGSGSPALPHDCGVMPGGGSGSPALPGDCGVLGGEPSVGRGVLDAPSHNCGGSGSPALPYRKRLSHDAPLRVDARNAIYFITICAADRGTANWVGRGINDAPPAATILNAARHYHRIGKWFVHSMVVMPDHLHALISFGASGVGGGSGVDGGSRTPRPTDAPRPTMMATVRQWKSYVAKAAGIRFQRDFWDTRIRDGSHLAERVDYMAKNPVRRGLSHAPEEWAWRFKGGDFKTGLRAAEDVRPYQRR